MHKLLCTALLVLIIRLGNAQLENLGTDPISGKSYYGDLNVVRDFFETNTICVENGYTMVMIKSEAEKRFLSRFQKRIWLGARDANFWMDGTPTTVVNWVRRPSGTQCPVLWGDGDYYAAICSYTNVHAVCELDPKSSKSKKSSVESSTSGTGLRDSSRSQAVESRLDRIERRLEVLANEIINRRGQSDEILNQINDKISRY